MGLYFLLSWTFKIVFKANPLKYYSLQAFSPFNLQLTFIVLQRLSLYFSPSKLGSTTALWIQNRLPSYHAFELVHWWEQSIQYFTSKCCKENWKDQPPFAFSALDGDPIVCLANQSWWVYARRLVKGPSSPPFYNHLRRLLLWCIGDAVYFYCYAKQSVASSLRQCVGRGV